MDGRQHNHYRYIQAHRISGALRAEKRMIAGVRGVCVGDKKKDGVSHNAATIGSMTTVEPPNDRQTTSHHPLVRTHPETGRKSLYIGGHVHWLEDMAEEESQPLAQPSPAVSAGSEGLWHSGTIAAPRISPSTITRRKPASCIV